MTRQTEWLGPSSIGNKETAHRPEGTDGEGRGPGPERQDSANLGSPRQLGPQPSGNVETPATEKMSLIFPSSSSKSPTDAF